MEDTFGEVMDDVVMRLSDDKCGVWKKVWDSILGVIIAGSWEREGDIVCISIASKTSILLTRLLKFWSVAWCNFLIFKIRKQINAKIRRKKPPMKMLTKRNYEN